MKGFTESAVAASLAFVLATPPPALAAVTFPARSSISHIQTSSSDFADATLAIDATTIVGQGSSGTRAIDFNASPEIISHTSTTTGDVSLVETGSPSSNRIQGTVTATGPNGGSFTVREQFVPGSDPFGAGPLFRYVDGNDTFYPFADPTLPTLELYLPLVGAGLVDQDGAFTIGFTITGDFSSSNDLASGPGQHFLAFLDPAWNITDNFTYDPVANLTSFSAINTAYKYDPAGDPRFDQSPQLDVYFFGSAASVPEPGSWATMALGFLFAGIALRRRRCARAARQGGA